MPIYEYRCDRCGKASSHFFRSISVVSEPSCPECGSKQMTRLISKVLHLKPDAQRLSELDTSRILGGLDGSDAGSFERWARRTGSDLDSTLGTNFRELADQAAAGADPIERVDPGHRLRYAVEKKLSESSGSSGDDI
jgi:putative FmdB family regulatory protein